MPHARVVKMKIAIAQLNFTVGDLAGNARMILDAARRARAEGAELLITPELALTGYPPEDLLLRDDFLHASATALTDLARQAAGIAITLIKDVTPIPHNGPRRAKVRRV